MMREQRTLVFWSAAFLVFLALVYVLKSMLLPFVLGIAIAYLLNPAVNGLSRIRLSRGPAALCILGVFLIFVSVFIAAVFPIIYKQLIELSQDIPGYADRLTAWAEPKIADLLAMAKLEGQADIKGLAGQLAAPTMNVANFLATNALQGLAAGGQALAHFLSVALIMPIVAYFMMKEWPNMTRWVIDLLPRGQKMTIMDLFKQIDQKLAGFVRGQLTVSLILAVGYALILSLVGLKYGFLIGLIAGFLSIIPMVGSTIGLLVGVIVAWLQTGGDWNFVVLIAGIFIAGQLLEGNLIAPKLIGDSVGLHPLWIFFALLAGASLFGILGMLLAVPVAAVISVLAGFAIRQYKSSAYYNDQKPDQKPDAES
jgi:predicted PurR-regulated permease PerM